YKEASVILPEGLTKRMEDLEKFYKHLTVNREKRLLDQKNHISQELLNLTQKFNKEKSELDKNLQYLNTHQALDIFVKLTNLLSELKGEKEQLERYDQLLKQYQEQKIKLERDFVDATAKTAAYLVEAEGMIKGLRDFFRELAKRFYPDAAAGITVYNNDGDNQIRYDYDAKIQADASRSEE